MRRPLLDEASLPDVTACGLNMPSPDSLVPERAAAAIWSWAPGQPSALFDTPPRSGWSAGETLGWRALSLLPRRLVAALRSWLLPSEAPVKVLPCAYDLFFLINERQTFTLIASSINERACIACWPNLVWNAWPANRIATHGLPMITILILKLNLRSNPHQEYPNQEKPRNSFIILNM